MLYAKKMANLVCSNSKKVCAAARTVCELFVIVEMESSAVRKERVRKDTSLPIKRQRASFVGSRDEPGNDSLINEYASFTIMRNS